jgi:small subunit ribosomal protein S16
MALTLRMSRHGTRHKPFYMIVALNSASKRDGNYIEKLGTYDPSGKVVGQRLKLNLEGINAWIKKGAIVSQTLGQLLKTAAK